VRAAIQEANWLEGDDAVMVPAGTFAITIPAEGQFEPSDADGSFYLDSTVDVVGAGNDVTILDGSEFSRVLDVSFNGVATVSDLTIQNGSHAGIAINEGTLALHKVIVQDNFGTELTEPGGIKSDNATLNLVESTVQRNTGANATGGILFTGSTFSAVDSVIRDNTGGMGIVSGGMICNFGTVTFERTAIIANQGNSEAALLVMSGCDAIPPEDCVGSDESPLANDQLGVERPQGSSCEIGAVDFAREPNAAIGHAVGLGAIGALLWRRRPERRGTR
jgi:hypothetical protein